jgi:hypothetical protein
MSKQSKTYKRIEPIADIILTGKLLCIDPSTGSKSSVPGYAWYEKGKLVESGEILVDIGGDRNTRLSEISRCIREDFDKPDVLVVEYIPPITYKGGGNQMNNISIMALQKAVGAIIGARPVSHFVEIPASSWRKYKPKDYIKSDVADAECIGLCAIGLAKLSKED